MAVLAAAGMTSSDYTAIGTISLAVATFAAVSVSIRLASREENRAQEVQAHSVQIKVSKTTGGVEPGEVTITATIVNSGDFTITDVRAWLCSDWSDLVEMDNRDAREDLDDPSELMLDEAFVILKGESRVYQQSCQASQLIEPYVITWWVDRWGVKWENRYSRVGRLVRASRFLTGPIVATHPIVRPDGSKIWSSSEAPWILSKVNLRYHLLERRDYIQALRTRYGWKWPFAGFIHRKRMRAARSVAARKRGRDTPTPHDKDAP